MSFIMPPSARGVVAASPQILKNAFLSSLLLPTPIQGVGGERSEPITSMLIMPYDTESQSRNADFILIAP